jgi:hypothetical protein
MRRPTRQARADTIEGAGGDAVASDDPGAIEPAAAALPVARAETDEQTWVTRSAPWRWGLAIAVAIAGLVIFLLATGTDAVCHQVVVNDAIKKLCGPPNVTQLVPAALLIGLLLSPDLSELGVAGLISLKRSVSEQANRQQRAEQELMRIEQRVANLNVNSNTTTVNNFLTAETSLSLEALPVREQQFDQAADATTRRRERGRADETGPARPIGEPPAQRPVEQRGGTRPQPRPTTGPARPQPPNRTERPEAARREAEPPPSVTPDDKFAAIFGDRRGRPPEPPEIEFIRLSRSLDQYQTITRARERGVPPPPMMAHLTSKQQDDADLFFSIFNEEVQTVMDVREALLHQPGTVDPEAVANATAVARRLLNILLGRLGLPNPFAEPA